MMRKSTFKERVSDDEFAKAWQASTSVYELAGTWGVTPNVVKIRACHLRRLGHDLKRMPPVSNGPRRQPPPRPKREAVTDLVFQPQRFATEMDYDEALAAINDPRMPLTDREMLADLTDEIYRRAAAIREARSGRPTPEDLKRPVDVTVIASSQVFDTRR